MNKILKRIGERLRRARLMRGLSLRGLSEAIGETVSHTQLQKFENGEATPDSKVLGALAGVLGVRPDYFFKKDGLSLAQVEYRKLSKLGSKAQQQLEEQALEFFERYLEIETILQISNLPLPVYDLSDCTPEEWGEKMEETSLRLRKKWELGSNPIPNVHRMLEEHGVKVCILPHQEGFDGFSGFAKGDNGDVPIIGLSAQLKEDLPRMRFTALHELAHLLHRFPEGMDRKTKENLCHRFAGAFLIPKERFLMEFGGDRVRIAMQELKAIKEEWGVSIAAIMKRACTLGLITAGRYKTFCIMANKQGSRVKEPGQWFGNEDSSRFQQLVHRGLAEDLITTTRASSLLNKSLAELSHDFKLVE